MASLGNPNGHMDHFLSVDDHSSNPHYTQGYTVAAEQSPDLQLICVKVNNKTTKN